MIMFLRAEQLIAKQSPYVLSTYDCPAWEFAADTHILKLQRLQNKVLRTTDHFPRRTPVRDLHVAFKIMQAASRSHTKPYK
jgi:hypothetical protein